MARRGDQGPRAYPRIEALGMVGDRRTAALVAPNGIIPWLCLPDYDGTPVLGSLLDAERGGRWWFGPAPPASGEQAYAGDTPILTTHWHAAGGELELTDLMPWPELERPGDRRGHRVVLRRLRCTRGTVHAAFRLRLRDGFEGSLPSTGGGGWRLGDARLGLWASFPLIMTGDGAEADLGLTAGEEAWAAFGLGVDRAAWSVETARRALADTARYWGNWLDGLVWAGPRRKQVLRSAVTIHLLGYAPAGAVVAAPTTSLPEVIWGEKNYDYRFAWTRDASLSLATLAVLGDLDPPAQLGQPDQALERDVGSEVGQPVLGRRGLVLGPLDQQPPLGPGFPTQEVAVPGPDPQRREARRQAAAGRARASASAATGAWSGAR